MSLSKSVKIIAHRQFRNFYFPHVQMGQLLKNHPYTIAREVAGKTGYLTKTTPSLVFLDRIVKKLKIKTRNVFKKVGVRCRVS